MRRGGKPAKPKVETKPPVVRKSNEGSKFRDLERRLAEALKREAEALEQQTATAEILRVISSSPTDVQPVFDAIAARAVTLCEALNGGVFRFDGSLIHLVAHHNWSPDELEAIRHFFPIPPGGGSVTARAILTGAVAYVLDPATDAEFVSGISMQAGLRTTLSVPMLRDGSPIGAITVAHREVKPFSETQIALLKTFASQAVIAVENVRLFNETKEALEQQTATSEILGVISSSPTDLQPVMDTVAENAARVCGAKDAFILRVEGNALQVVAHYGSLPTSRGIGERIPITLDSMYGRTVASRQTIHTDMAAAVETDFPDLKDRQRLTGIRTFLSTPLLREGVPIGVIAIRRTEVRPFSDKQIALLKTFADQAVIAIENVRLFKELEARTRELTQSVDELKALGEVSQAVSSTLDLDTVLTTIVARAVELSATDGGAIYEFDETAQEFELRATHGMTRELIEAVREAGVRVEEAVGRAATSRRPVQIPDIAEEPAYPVRDVMLRAGFRAFLVVPLVREDRLIGLLVVRRRTPGQLPEAIVNLLQTFATQSVLAIQNARLFREIADKSRQLEAASRHKSEFLANMSHELRTPLNAVIGFSEVLLERMFGEVNDKQTEYLQDILSSGQHLLSLINDILDLSKVEAGRLELELGRFHLPIALDNALTLVRERASRHGIALDVAVDAGVGDLVADERKVKQILLNLLSNAVKFTPEGGRVGLAATAAEGVVTIAVSDTGIGIAPEDQAAIFEEFCQVGRDDARKQEGTGLGLTLAKKFVELHGGRIWVQSQVGQGSTFTFILPVRPEATSSSE